MLVLVGFLIEVGGFVLVNLLVVTSFVQFVLVKVLHLQLIDDLLSPLDVLFVFLRSRVVKNLLNLYMLTLNTLHLFFLKGTMLPVLVKLWKARPYIIHKQLRELFIRLNNEAEKLAMVVVNYLTNLLFEWKWFKLFPRKFLCF